MVETARKRVRFSLQALIAAATLVSVAVALGSCLGGHGVVLVLDGLAIAILGANLLEYPKLFGITVPRLSILEYAVVAVICLMLHGLCPNPVKSEGYRRVGNVQAVPQVPNAQNPTLPANSERPQSPAPLR